MTINKMEVRNTIVFRSIPSVLLLMSRDDGVQILAFAAASVSVRNVMLA